MPIFLPPTTRRQFGKRSLALGGTAIVTSSTLAAADSGRTEFDPNRVALLADTHISADPDQVYPGTKVAWFTRQGGRARKRAHGTLSCTGGKSVVTLNPRPTHLIINGDCALSVGKVAEYKQFLKLVEPIRVAGITIHVTIGNHDNRKNLWKLLPFLKKSR